MLRPKIRARYQVKPLGPVTRIVNKAAYNKDTKLREIKPVEVTEEMFMVYFPQGHSTRLTKAELIAQGLHIKPRLVDMNTGDVVDIGGDEMDFAVSTSDDDENSLDELMEERSTRP